MTGPILEGVSSDLWIGSQGFQTESDIKRMRLPLALDTQETAVNERMRSGVQFNTVLWYCQ